MQKVRLEKCWYCNITWYFFSCEPDSISNDVCILSLNSLRHPKMISSHLISNDNPLTSKPQFRPIFGEGMNQWGTPKPKMLRIMKTKTVIIIYLDRNLKFECRLLPTSKPHFRPTFGEGLSPWGYQEKKFGKAIFYDEWINIWYILIFLMIKMIY